MQSNAAEVLMLTEDRDENVIVRTRDEFQRQEKET